MKPQYTNAMSNAGQWTSGDWLKVVAFSIVLVFIDLRIASAQVDGSAITGPYVDAKTDSGPAIDGQSFGGTGVKGMTSGGEINGVTDPEGAGVTGISRSASYPGVSGVSINNDGEGVFAKGLNGAHGQSTVGGKSGAWGEHQADGYGVGGSTGSPTRAGGIFTNLNSGDHLQAGPPGAPVFTVSNSGDVYIRGIPYSADGPAGDRGPQGFKGYRGDKGRTGSAGRQGTVRPMKSIATCGSTCGCRLGVLHTYYAQLGGPGCKATSDTGSCSINPGNVGICCVCKTQ